MPVWTRRRPEPDGEIPSAGQSNFRTSFLFLSRRRRRAITAVYAVCRAIDDCADEDDTRERALRRWEELRDGIDRAYRGSAATPLEAGLQQTLAAFPIDRSLFEELLLGVRMDIDRTTYSRFEDLELYCYRVASVVGLMCLPIFGCTSPASKEYARELGIALQLVNILRDIGEDLERGRIYLPHEDLVRAGTTEEALRARRGDEGMTRLLTAQIRRARERLDRVRCTLPRADARTLLPAEIMRAIYERLLRRIEKEPLRVLRERISISRSERLGAVVEGLARAVLPASRRSTPPGVPSA